MYRKAFLKGTLFIVIMIFTVFAISPILTLKTMHYTKLKQGLYENTGNSFDVLLMGSSHMNGGINPNILWSQEGITSFNYATGGQPIDVTYYLLKEAVKNHEPKVVVLDVYYLGLTQQFGEEGYIRYAIDSMKFSLNKIEAILNCTPRPHWLSYLVPIFKYHSRWKELNPEDFGIDEADTYYEKGFVAEHTAYGKDITNFAPTNEAAALPPKSEKYLNKIIELSKKEGFKLVFINAPYDYDATSASKNWVKEPQKMFNRVGQIAEGNGIQFINYNNLFSEINFDFKSDMYNSGHLNFKGAEKVSAHLGEVLKEGYGLEDHRNDSKYAQWNSEYEYYAQVENVNVLKAQRDIKSYIAQLQNENYVVILSYNKITQNNFNTVRESLGNLGLRLTSSVGNYAAIINSSSVDYEMGSDSNITKEAAIDKNISLKVATSSSDKNLPSIVLNGKEYENRYDGLNIVVYDKILDKVVDTVFLDANNVLRR